MGTLGLLRSARYRARNRDSEFAGDVTVSSAPSSAGHSARLGWQNVPAARWIDCAMRLGCHRSCWAPELARGATSLPTLVPCCPAQRSERTTVHVSTSMGSLPVFPLQSGRPGRGPMRATSYAATHVVSPSMEPPRTGACGHTVRQDCADGRLRFIRCEKRRAGHLELFQRRSPSPHRCRRRVPQRGDFGHLRYTIEHRGCPGSDLERAILGIGGDAACGCGWVREAGGG